MATKKTKKPFFDSEKDLVALVALLQKVFRRSIIQTISGLNTEQGKVEAIAQIGGIYSELQKSGLYNELAKISSIYANELRELKNRSPIGAFSAADKDTIEALVTFDIRKISQTIESTLGEARTVLARSVLLGETPSLDTADDLAGVLGHNLRTEVRTLLNSFARTVTIAKAKEAGFTLFEYQGPNDGVTRPFCEAVLTDRSPPIYSLKEIQEKEANDGNGQGLDILTYGGGWNCRHRWVPVSEEEAVSEGYVL